MKALTKKEVQQRISQNGKKLALSKFSWDSKTNTFSSAEDDLVIDFSWIDSATIKAGYSATIKAGYSATIDARNYATIKAGNYATIKAGYSATIKAGYSATIKAGYSAAIDAGYSATIKAGEKSVIIRRDEYQVIECDGSKKIKLCPCGIKGYLSKEKDSDKYYLNGDESLGEHIIVDNILSKVVSRKSNVLKVINHGQKHKSYIVLDGDIASHGDTIKEARESLLYKIGEIDTTEFEGLDIDEMRPLKDIIRMYRAIGPACEGGTKYFVESQNNVKKTYSIKEVADITQGQYGNNNFKEFFKIK